MAPKYDHGDLSKNELQISQAHDSFMEDYFAQSIKTIANVDKSVAQAAANFAQNSVNRSSFIRHSLVTLESLGYALKDGIWNGITYDGSHLGQLSCKALGAFTVGIGMRLFLPASGALKALAGSVMGGMFFLDAYEPLKEAYAQSDRVKDLNGVQKCAQAAGNGLGLLAVDSAVGMGIGIAGENFASRGLKWGLGRQAYTNFQSQKENIFNTSDILGGRSLNILADGIDGLCARTAEQISPGEPTVDIPHQEKIVLIRNSLRHDGFYRYGDGRGFGQTINDHLGENIAKADGIIGAPPPGRSTPEAGHRDPLNASVIADMAHVAREIQEAVSKEELQMWDVRTGVKAPIKSVLDNRRGPLYGPEYKRVGSQIQGIADQMTEQELNEIGQVLGLHVGAAQQVELGLNLVHNFNSYNASLYGGIRQNLHRLGVHSTVLENKTVPRTVETGSDNFTIPDIPNVIDGSVVTWPRTQHDLRGVWGDIQGHEVGGHNGIYPEIARFPEHERVLLVGAAVKEAMAAHNIDDVEMNVPGLGAMSKSSLFTRILLDEANECTSDIVGTARTGLGTPVSLGSLLQSLRQGGYLETRNVYGKQFGVNDQPGIEPHGIDRWRMILTADTLEELAQGKEDMVNAAKALRQYASDASRPGKNYVWANMDQKGQYFTIPRDEWDSISRFLVRKQLDTKLPALDNKYTLRDLFFDTQEIFEKAKVLGQQIADSARANARKLNTPFDKSDYDVADVFHAGLIAWGRLTADGVDPRRSLGLINAITDNLKAQYAASPQAGKQPLKPTAWRQARSQPQRAVRTAAASGLLAQKPLRETFSTWCSGIGESLTSVGIGQMFKLYLEPATQGQARILI